MPIRADLHCHSGFSDQPEERYLHRLGAREGYMEPRTLYGLARRRGMDVITITDHNDIRGGREIQDLPSTVLGVELTAAFPEDRCPVHVLAYGITEPQFQELMQLRDNLYELLAYLQRARIAHSLAHPLARLSPRFSLWHLERLLLLCPCFEVLNGSRHAANQDLMEWLLSRATAGLLSDLADAHGLEPVGESPWVKGRTGGSDDHSGLSVGQAWTVADGAADATGFLDQLRRGFTRAAGAAGSSYAVTRAFYSERCAGGSERGRLRPLVVEFLGQETTRRDIRWVRSPAA